jgi:hypothetical protein
MPEDPRRVVARHLAALATGDDARTAAELMRGAWPGGPADRREPAAAEWLRRWRPARAFAAGAACGCAAGRCAVCN